MRKHLYVGGTDLANYGVYVSGEGTFGAPEKEVTTYAVPGRNGLVLGVNERMENIEVTYPCFIYANFAQNMRDLRSFLLSRSGYVKINDDYDTTHFRMGFFEAGIDPNVTSKNNAARFDLTFNCQPQRWMTSGETVITITGSTTITNPTRFVAKPFIRVFASAWTAVDFSINQTHVSIEDTGGSITSGLTYVDIDCETNAVYSGDVKLSSVTSFWEDIDGFSRLYGVDAPTLAPGSNAVWKNSAVTKLEITPRFWEV